jgi:hypothetical protein
MKTEIITGSVKLPTKLYRLIDAKGNEVTETPVTYKELKEIILESNVMEALKQTFADDDRDIRLHEEEFKDYCNEYAIEEAKNCDYTVLEILIGQNYKHVCNHDVSERIRGM